MSELKSREDINVEQLYNRIANKIEVAKRNVMIQVNKEMTVLYWNIGKDIKEKLLGNEKAEYGKSVIKELSKRLVIEYGRGYSIRNIFNMLKFYEYYPNFEILQTLSAKLGMFRTSIVSLFLSMIFPALLSFQQKALQLIYSYKETPTVVIF